MTDYATATQIKAFTRVTYSEFRTLTTGQFDTFVALLAGFASRAMENYCGGRDWANHDDTATGVTYSVGPQNARTMRIKGPVISITSVETRSNPSGTWSTETSTNYTFKNFPEYGPIPMCPISHLTKVGFGAQDLGRRVQYLIPAPYSTQWQRARATFWRGYEDVRVKYTWGYATIPGEINQICIFIVDDWLKRAMKDEVGVRVKATTPEDLQMIMRYEIPEYLRKKLDLWKSPGSSAIV